MLDSTCTYKENKFIKLNTNYKQFNGATQPYVWHLCATFEHSKKVSNYFLAIASTCIFQSHTYIFKNTKFSFLFHSSCVV